MEPSEVPSTGDMQMKYRIHYSYEIIDHKCVLVAVQVFYKHQQLQVEPSWCLDLFNFKLIGG